MPRSRILRMSPIRSVGLLLVHAAGGLVQHQQPGLGGQGPGDLQQALVAVGEVAGQLPAPGPAGPTKASSSSDLRQGLPLLPALARACGAWPRGARPASGSGGRPARSPGTERFWNRRMFWKVRAMPERHDAVRAQPRDGLALEEDLSPGPAGRCR